MTAKQATRDAYGETLLELGRENPDIVVLDADLSKSTKTYAFGRQFPDRFFNVGIAEQNLMSTAAGLAAAGKIPFASTFAVFATGRAYDQIRNSIAYARLGVKIAASHAGLTVGEDGGSHQALEDIALMRVIPNMTVLVPADGPSASALVREAAALPGPVYIRLGRSKVPVIYRGGDFSAGGSRLLRRGRDVLIAACGIMVAVALEAAEELAAAGIEASVLDLYSIKPLDGETLLEAARECGAVVTAEEHSVIGGLGGAVSEYLSGLHPVPVIRVGVQDLFGQSGTPEELLDFYGLTPAGIVSAARKAIAMKKG